MTDPPGTHPSSDAPERRPGRLAPARQVFGAIGATAVLAIVLVLVVGGVRSASGRFAGTTTNEGSLLSAAALDLTVTADAPGGAPGGGAATVQQLAIDVSEMLPGDVVRRCLVVAYRGAIDDVDIRLMGRRDGGTGLDRYLDASVLLGSGADPECTDFEESATAFGGSLRDLSDVHGSFATGVPVLTSASDGENITVQVRITLGDDNRAQGADTRFWMVLEVRP